ncbi:22096_t:CDS:1, partial [Racocetra persica]
MIAARSYLREIISILRHNNISILILNKDIYNACEQLRQQNFAGYTPIQALIDKLKKGNFIY